MIWKYTKHVLLVFVLVMSTVAIMQAQVSSVAWMRVYEDGALKDSVIFGTHTGASYSLDAGLGESVAPPPPPGGLDIVYKTLPGRADASWDRGLLHKCLYFHFSQAKKDTFILEFANGDAGSGSRTIRFEWDSTLFSQPGGVCDSAFLVDPTGQIVTPNVKMSTQSSMDVVGMLDLINRMRIYVWGSYIVNTVRQTSTTIPGGYSLYQNYPNPFNPTTTLKFDIQQSAITDISVYNMLGQKVSTLVARQLTPGTYTTEWNGTNDQGMPVTSGVYFVRMSAKGTGSDGLTESFSAVRKLVFMK